MLFQSLGLEEIENIVAEIEREKEAGKLSNMYCLLLY